MLEIFLFAVFSFCTFKLAIKESIIIIDYNILYLNWFRDYPHRSTLYRFGFSVVTSLLIVESITRQWNIDISLIYFLFFSEKMNLIPNQTISAATLFEVFQWWINEKEMPVVCLWSTCIRVTTTWIKILLLCSNLACTIITSATKTNLKSLHNYSNHYFLFLFIQGVISKFFPSKY